MVVGLSCVGVAMEEDDEESLGSLWLSSVRFEGDMARVLWSAGGG
jgi:hypothetical protein